jgi:Protein of unknown function (DUF2950)
MPNMLKQTIWCARYWQSRLRGTICAMVLFTLAALSLPAVSAQMRFVSPEAAVAALVEAIKSDDQPALRAILGPYGSKLVRSGDPVADEQNREKFSLAYGEANRIILEGDKRAQLSIGKDGWPMPIPLVKANDGNWRFDTRAAEAEILNRRIGRNELAAIQVCLAIVDAEREYAGRDAHGGGLREYAARFMSTLDKHDGLYWPTNPDEQLSPLGPLLAAAAKDGYTSPDSGSLAPYHGYFYKILTKQGKGAPGGAYNYFVNGKMIAGFALIAYPARYGASGIMSFIVNQDAIVYEKNLGKNTTAIASRLTTFSPDASWKRARQQGPAK